MNCDQARDLVSARLDEKVPSSEHMPLDAHLQECASCRARADAFRHQDTELRRAFLPRRQAALAVAERVIAQMRSAPAQATPGWPAPQERWLWSNGPRRAWALTAIAVAAAACLAFLLTM